MRRLYFAFPWESSWPKAVSHRSFPSPTPKQEEEALERERAQLYFPDATRGMIPSQHPNPSLHLAPEEKQVDPNRWGAKDDVDTEAHEEMIGVTGEILW